MQALYAHEITGDPVEHVMSCTLVSLKDNKDAFQFAKELVVETINHSAAIDGIIKSKVANWDFKRIALLDRLILRMAICELKYFNEIPPKVSMNEAIELAKLFSTDKSGQFVNGVLDAIFDDLKTAGELTKTGRGLWGGDSSQRTNKTKIRKDAQP